MRITIQYNTTYEIIYIITRKCDLLFAAAPGQPCCLQESLEILLDPLLEGFVYEICKFRQSWNVLKANIVLLIGVSHNSEIDKLIIYALTSVCIYECKCVHKYTCKYIHVTTCVFTSTYLHTYTYLQACSLYAFIHSCTQVHM